MPQSDQPDHPNPSHPSEPFLTRLLTTPGPSGDEMTAARVWRAEARTFADEVFADVRGNSYALLHNAGPRVLLAGHIDEIGLMISYIDEEGFLYFDAVGGWDAQVLVGQRVRLPGQAGQPATTIGVIGQKPIHLKRDDERTSAMKLDGLWIDIGARTRAEAEEYVSVGTVGVIDAPPCELPNRRIVSRGLDNRIGAFIVLEVLRRLEQARPVASVAAVATTQEETTLTGAMVAAFRFDPHVALIVDVTYATDHPESNRRRDGDVKLGGGPVFSRGGANSPLLYDRLLAVARHEQIPYSLQITPRFTNTDADAIHCVRGGVATALVSIPSRYLHSPSEMVALEDAEQTIRLLVALVQTLQSADEFIPE